jgi:hypothetical protein
VAERVGRADGVRVFAPAGCPKSGPESVGVARQGGAGSARSPTVQGPSLWAPCRARAIRWSPGGSICPQHGPRPRRAWTKRACPWPPAGIARGPSGRWPWCRPVARGSHMGGSRAMTRGGGRSGFVAGSRAWVSALGWRGRARRCSGPWRPRCRHPAGGAVPRGLPGNTSRWGVPRLTRTPGSASTGATAPQGRWWSTRSNDVWGRGRRGGNKAPRHCESGDRDRDPQQGVQVDLSLSHAAPETPLGQWARVAKAAQRLEACRQRSTSAAGVAADEVRHWTGWPQHQTRSLLATGLLVTETLRGKKMDASDDGTADTHGHRGALVQGVSVRDDITYAA